MLHNWTYPSAEFESPHGFRRFPTYILLTSIHKYVILLLSRQRGVTRPQVSRLILAEMATLGTIAALIGTALGWVVTLSFLSVARAYLGLTGDGAQS